jgi:hypothetical protein
MSIFITLYMIFNHYILLRKVIYLWWIIFSYFSIFPNIFLFLLSLIFVHIHLILIMIINLNILYLYILNICCIILFFRFYNIWSLDLLLSFIINLIYLLCWNIRNQKRWLTTLYSLEIFYSFIVIVWRKIWNRNTMSYKLFDTFEIITK